MAHETPIHDHTLGGNHRFDYWILTACPSSIIPLTMVTVCEPELVVWNSMECSEVIRSRRVESMCRIRGSVVAVLACASLLFAGDPTEVEVSPNEVTRLVVTTMRAITGMVQIGDSISDSNAHMVIAYLKPPRGERI